MFGIADHGWQFYGLHSVGLPWEELVKRSSHQQQNWLLPMIKLDVLSKGHQWRESFRAVPIPIRRWQSG